jgi:hypothetical protein
MMMIMKAAVVVVIFQRFNLHLQILNQKVSKVLIFERLASNPKLFTTQCSVSFHAPNPSVLSLVAACFI